MATCWARAIHGARRRFGGRCRAPRRLPNASWEGVGFSCFQWTRRRIRIGLCWSPFVTQDIPDRDRFAETPEIHRVVSTLRNKRKCEPTRHDRSLPCNTAATTKKPQRKKHKQGTNSMQVKKVYTKKHNSVKGKSNGKHSKDRQNEEANGTPSPSPAPPALALPLGSNPPPSETSRCVVCFHE